MRASASKSSPQAAPTVVPLRFCAEDDSKAQFEAVYRRHFRQVYRWATRLLPEADAEDICQEVFVVVHRKLPEFEGRSKITTWLFQITYRVAGAYVRRERLKRQVYQLLRLTEPRHTTSHAESDVGRSQEAEIVRQALSTLPLKHRSVLVMFELEHWSCQDIALSLGIPTDTVYSRLHHARRKLANKVARRLGDTP